MDQESVTLEPEKLAVDHTTADCKVNEVSEDNLLAVSTYNTNTTTEDSVKDNLPLERNGTVDILGGGDCVKSGETSGQADCKVQDLSPQSIPNNLAEMLGDINLELETNHVDLTPEHALPDEYLTEKFLKSLDSAEITYSSKKNEGITDVLLKEGKFEDVKLHTSENESCSVVKDSIDAEKLLIVTPKISLCTSDVENNNVVIEQNVEKMDSDEITPKEQTSTNTEQDTQYHEVEKKEENQVSEKMNEEIKEIEENDQGSEADGEKATESTSDAQKLRSRTYPYKVLVSGLPLNVRLEDIAYYFSQFGEVLKIFKEGRHRANVLFSDEESVKKAVFFPDPYYDDHKLLIRSVNESTAVLSGIPRSLLVKEAEKAIKTTMQEAGVPVCRVSLPITDSFDLSDLPLLQGHAFIVFSDPQTIQRADEKQKEEPFIVANSPVVLFTTINQFYKQFCVRIYPVPPEHPRSVVYQNVYTTLSGCGGIIALSCQYVPSSSAFAVYVLYETEEAVKKALAMEDVKVLDQMVEIQEFHPFESGQGFRHMWLKVLNLPSRVTVTEIKHHFKHDRGILYVELDVDFGSCFIHVDSEQTLQRCLRMHQTYFRGKCITVLIADEHPGRSNYYRGSRQGRNRHNYGNNRNMKKNTGGGSRGSGGVNGTTFTSGQNSGNQEKRAYERKDRKFSKSRNNNTEGSKVSPRLAKEDTGGEKAAENAA